MATINIPGRNLTGLLEHAKEQGVYPNTTGIWRIYGEDPNPDMGGYHNEPHLDTVKGTFLQAAERAINLPSFVGWGAGGHIEGEGVLSLREAAKTLFDSIQNAINQISVSKLDTQAYIDIQEMNLHLAQKNLLHVIEWVERHQG